MNTPLSAEQLANWREKLKQGREKLAEHFARQRDPRWVMKRATDMVDVIIREVWQALALGERAAAIAVGGYGRAQQFPHSDIDLLVLLPENPDQALSAAVEQLIGALWDVGMEVGHSVRTLSECMAEAAGDITIETTLLENRCLIR
jgi:[protein-PII] uridylyltransferase